MSYLLNIGNTHTQVGIMEEGNPRLLTTCETPEITATGHIPYLDHARIPWSATASSVVPAAREALERTYGRRIRFLSAGDFPQLDFSQVDTTTLGIDRICNAAGALAYVGHGPVAIFDFGTCMASEAIDGSNRFMGGVIAPGRRLLRQVLHEHTAQLPLIPLQHGRPQALGCNTAKAMEAGTDLGILGTARFLIDETRRALHAPGCIVFAAGGDAPFFLRFLPELTPAPGFLTLRGIAEASVMDERG